jgi:hypothetical protein
MPTAMVNLASRFAVAKYQTIKNPFASTPVVESWPVPILSESTPNHKQSYYQCELL